MRKGILKHQKKLDLVQKGFISSGFIMMLTIFGFSTSAFAVDDKFALIKTVYHVYVDGIDIGLVHDKNVVTRVKEQRIKEEEDQFKDTQFTIK